MAYFQYFPKMYYDVRGQSNQAQHDVVTNILARVLVKSHGWANVDGEVHELLTGATYFAQHYIKDFERPDILADKYYGDSELHWLFFFANGTKMINPYFDWPMTQYDLVKYINKKYGSANINDTHHYIDGDRYEVDSDAPSATAVTNFIYEQELNDNKRPIRILQNSMVAPVVDEFKRLLNDHTV